MVFFDNEVHVIDVFNSELIHSAINSIPRKYRFLESLDWSKIWFIDSSRPKKVGENFLSRLEDTNLQTDEVSFDCLKRLNFYFQILILDNRVILTRDFCSRTRHYVK